MLYLDGNVDITVLDVLHSMTFSDYDKNSQCCFYKYVQKYFYPLSKNEKNKAKQQQYHYSSCFLK